MSRPAWPEQLKKELGYRKGDNIRHVIRNATLKRALDIEWNKWKGDPERGSHYIEQLASAVDVDVPPSGQVQALIPAIYRKVYLNRDNLFSGQGTMNQVIGFSADRVRNYGEELFAQDQAPVDLKDVANKVVGCIKSAVAQVGADDKGVEQSVIGYLCSAVEEILKVLGAKPTAAEAGDLVADIGVNFGFDLIEGQVDEDRNDIADRQGRLVKVETALQKFIRSNGKDGTLVEIFGLFMPTSASSLGNRKRGPDESEGSESGVKKRKTEHHE